MPGRRADLLFGVVLVALGITVAFESWRMPRLTELGVHPMTAPGLVPGLLGLVTALLGSILAARSVRTGNDSMASVLGSDSRNLTRQAGRFALTLVLCLAYAVVLVGRVEFWLATGLFVFTFIVLFEWNGERDTSGHVRAFVFAGIQAVVVSALVTVVFERIFLVRLP
jgi:hypothetical protein